MPLGSDKRYGKGVNAALVLLAVCSGLVGWGSAPGLAAASPTTRTSHKPSRIPDLANPMSGAGTAFLANLFPVNSADWNAGRMFVEFDAAIQSKQFDPCLESKGFPLPGGPHELGGTNNLTFPDLSRLATVGFYGPTTTKTTSSPTTNHTPSYQQAYQAAQKACSKAVNDPLRKLTEKFTAAGSLGTQWFSIIQRINHMPAVTKALKVWRGCMAHAGVVVPTPTAFFGQVTRVMQSLPHSQAIPQEKHLAKIYARCFGPVEALRVRLRIRQRDKFFAEHAEEIDAAMRQVTRDVAHMSSKFHTPFEVKRRS